MQTYECVCVCVQCVRVCIRSSECAHCVGSLITAALPTRCFTFPPCCCAGWWQAAGLPALRVANVAGGTSFAGKLLANTRAHTHTHAYRIARSGYASSAQVLRTHPYFRQTQRHTTKTKTTATKPPQSTTTKQLSSRFNTSNRLLVCIRAHTTTR